MLNPSRRGEATTTHQHGTVDGTWHLAKFKTKTTHNDLVIQESRGLLSFSVYCLCCAARSYSFSLKIFSAFEWNWNNMKFMTNKLCKMISLKTPNYLACQSFRSFHSANTHNSFHFKVLWRKAHPKQTQAFKLSIFLHYNEHSAIGPALIPYHTALNIPIPVRLSTWIWISVSLQKWIRARVWVKFLCSRAQANFERPLDSNLEVRDLSRNWEIMAIIGLVLAGALKA